MGLKNIGEVRGVQATLKTAKELEKQTQLLEQISKQLGWLAKLSDQQAQLLTLLADRKEP